MGTLAFIFVILTAGLHFLFFIGECFFWEKLGPRMLKTKDMDFVSKTKVMAQNQGIYNLLVSAGIFYLALVEKASGDSSMLLLFLGFVVFAGLFGGWTVKSKVIPAVQSTPAFLALVFLQF